MANVIKSLLVGIGFDLDRESKTDIDSAFSDIISKGKTLGAVLAGAFGISSLKTMAADFADAKAKMGSFGETFSVQANEVQALGTAFEASGGSVEKLQGQLENLITKRDRLKVGDIGWFPDAFKAGFDAESFANAKSGIDAYLNVADQLKNMDPQGRRLAADALGFDAESITFLSKGAGALRAEMEKFSRIRPITQDMINDAREYNKQWTELAANANSFADAVGQKMAVGASEFFKYLNQYFDKNRGSVGSALANDWMAGMGALLTGQALMTPQQEAINNQNVDEILGRWGISDGNGGIKLPTLDLFGSAPQQQSQVYRGRVERAPQPAQPIEVNLVLDGKVIDKRIITIQERAAQRAITDLKNSEGGG